MSDPNHEIKICLAGCGGFAGFTLEQYSRMPEVEVSALVDPDRKRLEETARRFDVANTFSGLDEALTAGGFDAAVIATPPHLHYPQVKMCLEAGVHVMCEKPLSLFPEQARELAELARQRNLRLSCNYVMRFNPYYRVLGQIVKSGILGPVNSFNFRNYACDQFLPPDHWFWDREKSGGIFVEHGVHFFDEMNHLLGMGHHRWSHTSDRPESKIQDRVGATVIYPGGITGSFYHSFTQKKVVERNYLEIAFKWGYLNLHQWIPTFLTGEVWLSSQTYLEFEKMLFEGISSRTQLTVENSLVKQNPPTMSPGNLPNPDDVTLKKKPEILSGPVIRELHYKEEGGDRYCFSVTSRITPGKTPVYAEAVTLCMEDFIAGIKDPAHQMKIDLGGVVESIALAQKCTQEAMEMKYE